MVNIINLTCPRCGAAVSTEQKVCEYCHSPIVISSLSSLNNIDLSKYIQVYNKGLQSDSSNGMLNTSLAMCYLKLKLYDKAISHFGIALDNDINNPDIYYYCCIALLRGKRPYSTPLSNIRQILAYLDAAISIQDKNIYHSFSAYIKYDYFERKFINVTPSYQEEWDIVKNSISQEEIKQLFEELEQEIPVIFKK